MATEASAWVEFAIPEEEVELTSTILGEGSFATVYKATWKGAVVAVKCIRERSRRDPAAPASERESEEHLVVLDVFRKEAKVSCGLLHPRIVLLFGVYAPDTRQVGLVMELMETSLRSRVKKGPPLATRCAVHILHDITSALTFLHSRKILHRDIAPRNILLSGDSAERRLIAKLSDFATAKAVETIGFDSHTSNQTGNFSYLPYEALDKDPFTDKLVYSSAVDMYSVGAVGLFSVLQKDPGSTPRAKATYLQLVRSDHPLYALLQKCLEDDPRQRPSSAQLLADLCGVRVCQRCTCYAVTVQTSAVAEQASAVAEEVSALAEKDSIIAEKDSAIAELQRAKEGLEEHIFIEKVRLYNNTMGCHHESGSLETSDFPKWKSFTSSPLPADVKKRACTAIHGDHLFVSSNAQSTGSFLVRTNDLQHWDKLQPPPGSNDCHGLLSNDICFYALYSAGLSDDDRCTLFELKSVNTHAVDDTGRMHTEWEQLPNGHSPIVQRAPAFFFNKEQSQIVLAGGYRPEVGSTSLVCQYCLIEKNWVKPVWPPLPGPRHGLSAVFLDNHIHLIGGEQKECRSVLSAAVTGGAQDNSKWKTDVLPPIPVFITYGVCKLFGTVVIAGGTLKQRDASTQACVYALDRKNSTWIKLPPMVTPRYCTSLICFRDQLLVIGGKGLQAEWMSTCEQLSLANFEIS